MFSRSSPAKNPNPQASIVFMDEDRSTSSLLGRLARDILPKPSYTSALPSSSRVALDGTATTSTTFPPTAELRDEDFVMSQQFDPGSQRTMPPIPGGSMSRRTWRRNLPLATPDPSHFSSGTDSQIGRYKSERRAGDRLRSLNLPSTQKMMHSAIDKIKHKTGKALKARRLHRGLNWMQLRNMNKRAEKEEEGESGLSKITAKQLGEILRRSHDVPQVVMPGSKGKERAVEENNDGDTDNGDTDTDVGGDTDDEKEDKENVGPNAGPSTPHAQGAVRRESLVTSSVNAQEPVTPTRMLISSTRRGTVEEGNDKGRPELPKTPIPNRKLMHSVSSLTFPVVEEVSDTPTKPLRKHASDPLVLRNLSEEACRSKVTNSTGLSQFPFVQPTTFDLPGDITQSIFQEKLVVQQPLPQFSDINIPPIISDQDIVEQLHIEIDNQQQRIIEEVYTTSSDVHQSGDPQFVPFDNTAQLTLQEAQQPQFSFPDYTNQPLTLEQPQVSSHESSALQLQSSVSAANNPLSQFTFQMQQQQAFSFMPMSSTFQQGAAQAMENVDHQPQPTVPQPAEGPARTDDAFPILSSLFLNSAIAPIPQNTRLTNELSIPIEDSTLKQSSLFGSSGAEAFVKEEPILPHRPTPTDSFDILVEVDDKSWGAKRRRHREHRNVRRRTVFGPLNHRHLPTPPKTAYTTHLPRGSEEDLIRRLNSEEQKGKKRVRIMLSEDEPVRKKRRTDENSVHGVKESVRTPVVSKCRSTSDQNSPSPRLHTPPEERESDLVMPGAYNLQSEQRDKKGSKKPIHFSSPDDELVGKKRPAEGESAHTPETCASSTSQITRQNDPRASASQQETDVDPVMPGAYVLQADDCARVASIANKSIKYRRGLGFGEILLFSFLWRQTSA